MRLFRKYRKIIRKMAGKLFPGEEKVNDPLFQETLPDIGGKANMQFRDLDFLVAFFAFYEACDRRIGAG